MSTIVLTGGGTAGHVVPNISLLPYLKEKFDKICYIGSDGIEKNIAADYGLDFYCISASKLKRSLSLSNLLLPAKLIKSVCQAKKHLKTIRPNVVFSKGGYVALPVAIAAKKLKIPVVSHESDMTAGLANRIAIKYSDIICTTFKNAANQLGKKAVCTGSPIRQQIYDGSRQKGLEIMGLSGSRPIILFMGGSLGSVAINKCVLESLDSLTKDFDVCHIVGKNNKNPVTHKNYVQIEYYKDIQHLFAASDIVVSRAGSNAACEILSLKKPCLFIPLPRSASRGDQIQNADFFTEQKMAAVLYQENMTKQTLIQSINDLYANRFEYKKILQTANSLDGTKAVCDIIEKLYTTKN